MTSIHRRALSVASHPVAVIFLAVLLILLPINAHTTTISTDIVVDNTEDSLSTSGDTITGDITAINSGQLTMEVDSTTVTGNVHSTSNGHIIINSMGYSVFAGEVKADNGGDANVKLFGASRVTGLVDVDNSGGYLELEANEEAEVSGLVSGGSHSLTAITLRDSGKMTGGMESVDGGIVGITASGNAVISGALQSLGSGDFSIHTLDAAQVSGDVTVQGGSQAAFSLTGASGYGGTMNNSGGSRLAIEARDNAVVLGNLATSGGSNTQFDLFSASQYRGNLLNSATTNVTLSDAASMTGASVITSWGTTNIALNGPATSWQVTQAPTTSSAAGASGTQYASSVTNLSLADGAWVRLGAQNYSLAGASDRVQLDVNSLTGNGNFEIRVLVDGYGETASNAGDLLRTASTAGSHGIYVPSKQLGLGAVAVNGMEQLRVVQTQDGNGSFALYNGQNVDIGHLTYSLSQIGTDWYLVGAGPALPPDGGGTDGGTGGGDGGTGGGTGGGDGGTGGGDGGTGGGDGGTGGGDGGTGGGDGGTGGGDGGTGGGGGGTGGGDGGTGGGTGGGDGGTGGGDGGTGGGDGGTGGGDGGTGGGDGGTGGGDGGTGGGDGGTGGGDGGTGGGDGGTGGGDGGTGGGDGGTGGGDGGTGGGDGGTGGGDGGTGGGTGGDDGGTGGGDGGTGGGDGDGDGNGNGGNGDGDGDGDGDGGTDGGDGDGDGDGSPEEPEVPQVSPPSKKLNSAAQASTSFLTTNYVLNFVEYQTLLERMGDLRRRRDGDLWIRGHGGRVSSFSFNQLSGHSFDYYGLQGGGDVRLPSSDIFLGVMAGYTETDPRRRMGRSKAKSFHTGLYGLYGTEDDFYVDVVLKYAHVRDKFDVKDSQSQRVTGKGSSNAWSGGVEFGKRFYLAENREGAYAEPQVQALFTHQRGLSFKASSGLRSDMDSYNSYIMRFGGLLGYNIKEVPLPLDIYVKGGYLHEFAGSVDTRYNGNHHDTYNFRGGWWDVGFGVNTEINKRHSIYADIGYSKGDRFDNRRFNIGYRFSF